MMITVEMVEAALKELEGRRVNVKSITSYPIIDEITKPEDSYKKFRQIGEQIVFEIIDERSNKDEN